MGGCGGIAAGGGGGAAYAPPKAADAFGAVEAVVGGGPRIGLSEASTLGVITALPMPRPDSAIGGGRGSGCHCIRGPRPKLRIQPPQKRCLE